jgi:hypothetical protein
MKGDHEDFNAPDAPWDGKPRREADFQPALHCSEHSGNMEFFRTVNQKLNWCLSGVAVLLAAMAYLLMTQISDGKSIITLLENQRQNTADIRALQVAGARQAEEINSLFRWRERWEAKESFSHEVKGVETHHLEEYKQK